MSDRHTLGSEHDSEDMRHEEKWHQHRLGHASVMDDAFSGPGVQCRPGAAHDAQSEPKSIDDLCHLRKETFAVHG
jgi:hypothetical protein